MKQYLSPEQTAKLIELGFEKPASIASVEPTYGMGGISIAKAYSVGELIEILGGVSELEIIRSGRGWDAGDELRAFTSGELIDALYDMIIILKEVGVI
jgi:hypothetical protein